MSNSSAHIKQPYLNLGRIEFSLAEEIRTEAVRELIWILTKRKISAGEILQRGRNQQLQIPYQQGSLVVLPSPHRRSGRYWLWNVVLAPTCLTKVPA